MQKSLTALCLVVLSALVPNPLNAQLRGTTSDGVFTSAQAARGKAHFAAACAECHGADLISPNRPPLKGQRFLDHWTEGRLDALFARIKSMPSRANLNESAYVEVLAFLLDANGFPTGTRDLDAEAISDTWVQGKNGPGPVPNFALVDVVACFTRAPHDRWILTLGSEPVRTRLPLRPSKSEIAAAKAKPLGSHTFQLLDVEYFSGTFRPQAHAGHKVNAKGFLIRAGSDERINVTWIEGLAGDCPY